MYTNQHVNLQEQVLTDAIELFLDITRSDAQGVIEAMDDTKRDIILNAMSKAITENI